MSSARRAPRAESGFSLIEVVIAISILSIGIAAVMQVMGESSGVVSHTSTQAELTTTIDKAIEAIAATVGNSGSDDAVNYVYSHPATATTTLDYLELSTKTDVASDTWDTANPIRYRLIAGTIGTLTSEQESVATKALVMEQGGSTRVIADGVTFLRFHRENGVTTLEMTLELARYDRGSKRIFRRRAGPHHMIPGNF